eukprot:1157976-Pelagomonas_calceolata.AAC.10
MCGQHAVLEALTQHSLKRHAWTICCLRGIETTLRVRCVPCSPFVPFSTHVNGVLTLGAQKSSKRCKPCCSSSKCLPHLMPKLRSDVLPGAQREKRADASRTATQLSVFYTLHLSAPAPQSVFFALHLSAGVTCCKAHQQSRQKMQVALQLPRASSSQYT